MPGHPRLIFGAASVGMNFLNPTDVQTLFDALKSAGVTHVDTAGRYPATQPGRSEELLGEVKAAEQGFTIDTKILAVGGDGSGELEKASIERSINKSLERMQIPNVNTLHIHRPDPRTPLEEQAKALNDIYKEGKFKSVGFYSSRTPRLTKASPKMPHLSSSESRSSPRRCSASFSPFAMPEATLNPASTRAITAPSTAPWKSYSYHLCASTAWSSTLTGTSYLLSPFLFLDSPCAVSKKLMTS